MDNIAENIRFLRKNKKITQDELAKKVGVNRAVIGSYEEGRAIPKLPVLQRVANYFGLSIDEIVNAELWEKDDYGNQQTFDFKGEKIRVISILVNPENKELVTLVPAQASAGYTKGYADPGYIEELPVFDLPLPELGKDRTYRIFQVKGNSMHPITSGSYIICEYVLNWDDFSEGKSYIVITRDDGIVYKRLFHGDANEIFLKSDNPEYEPYTIQKKEILEIWKAIGFISFELPEQNKLTLTSLHNMVMDLRKDVDSMKNI